jgi:hypothetical protein
MSVAAVARLLGNSNGTGDRGLLGSGGSGAMHPLSTMCSLIRPSTVLLSAIVRRW